MTDAGTEQLLSFDVVIVGAGVAGTSAAYHLWIQQQQSKNSTPTTPTTNILLVDAAEQAGCGVAPRHSGTATLQQQQHNNDKKPSCIKMMVQLYASSSEEFVRRHGTLGAQRYLRATAQGLALQKQLAHQLLQQQQSHVFLHELGSYYVAYEADQEALRHEYELLQQLLRLEDEEDAAAVVEWCDRERLQTVPGMSPMFHCAIYFPNDAIIDSQLYTQTLLEYMLQQQQQQQQQESNKPPRLQFWPNTTVRNVTEHESHAVVEFESGPSVSCQHVVMATGGLLFPSSCFLRDHEKLLKPCYSYLAHVPIPVAQEDSAGAESKPTTTTTSPVSCDYSANFFTWGFTHDWCWTEGRIRVSGEDHFSALQPPFMEERCGNLIRWTRKQYTDSGGGSNLDDNKDDDDPNIPQQYGVYSETPDMVPLIGHWNDDTATAKRRRICYLVGCNAWGQTILSYCSSLIPGLLGYRELTASEKDCLQLLTIRRFATGTSLPEESEHGECVECSP